MPELIRTAVLRVRTYFKDLRQSPRLRLRLMFTISIHRPEKNGLYRQPKVLRGHTRDISLSGMALLVPRVHLDGHHFAAEGRELEVCLEWGSEPPVLLTVVPNRYQQLDEPELGCAYLLGVRVVRMEEADRLRYAQLLREGLAAADA